MSTIWSRKKRSKKLRKPQKIYFCRLQNLSAALHVSVLTVYDIGRHEASYYYYDHTMSSKGSNEVSSLLDHYYSERIIRRIIKCESFSDNCRGQNRNRFVIALFSHITNTFLNISLKHTFLECGHTQNEENSVHAVFESRNKIKDVFSPQMWYEYIRRAKLSNVKSSKTWYLT